MAAFQKAREALSLAHYEKIITAKEYFLLNDLNTSKNLHFQHWQRDSFKHNANQNLDFTEMIYPDLPKY